MKIKLIKGGLTLLSVFAVASITQAQTDKKKYIDSANMDLTVKPGDDFYQYASGTWIKNNPVPAKEIRWGSFDVLHEYNSQAVKGLLETAAADKTAKPGSITKRVGDFYAAAIDTLAIEKLGYTPIKGELEKINQIKDLQGILNHAAYLRTLGSFSPMFGIGVSQDKKNATKYIVYLSQNGTTLPDRDYYLKNDDQTKRIQAAYNTYMITLFGLIGYRQEQAQKKAETIFNIEKNLAQAQMTRIEMRDPEKTYNKQSVSEFNKTTPNMSWDKLLLLHKIKKQDTIIINSISFFKTLDTLLKTVPVTDWKTYLEWNILKTSAPYLSSPFVNANFAFTQVQTGQKLQKPRSERMANLTDKSIGELLGQLYVAKYFKPEAKARMEEMISNLRKAFEIRIKNLDWMSDATKEKALAKLHAFTPKVGYPAKWKTYNGLEISRNNFFQNLKNASAWAYQDNISKLGQPIDKITFNMTPPTVNAYYKPTMNEIVFPAGILQFPFFDPNADDAINYGGIGAVIGHELSHGFDDQGSRYDANGNLKNWWTSEDKAKFEAKSKNLIEQYNAYTVNDTIHVQGKFTLGENIGDLGGINVAYTAFKMTKQGQSNTKIDGFTSDQRFFLSWAQVWRRNILPETSAQFIKTDPHSPEKYRTIGPLVNMDVWYNAFDIQPGDKLYKKPEDRIKIW